MSTVSTLNPYGYKQAHCDNCGCKWSIDQLQPIADAQERLSAGEETPAGECPECNALAYVVRKTPELARIVRKEREYEMSTLEIIVLLRCAFEAMPYPLFHPDPTPPSTQEALAIWLAFDCITLVSGNMPDAHYQLTAKGDAQVKMYRQQPLCEAVSTYI